jgi:PAS domain S-box-containing protein
MNSEKQDFIDPEKLRKKAELKLKEKQNKSTVPEGELEIKKLLHELQVHQIELEMQNEELRQAYETTEIALKKYTMLYEFAPVGYFSIDQDGSISELNFTGAEMLGEKRFSLTGANFRLFISDDSKSEFDHFLSRVFTMEGKDECVVKLGYDNKESHRVYMEGVVLEEDRQCLLSVVDISAFKTSN